MSFVFETVSRVFRKRPFLLNSLTGFASFSLGDLLAQSVDNKTVKAEAQKLDVTRAAKIGCLGCVVNGVVMVYWFRVLDRVCGHSMTDPRVLISKTVLDQVVYAPISISAFYAYTSFLTPGAAGWKSTFLQTMEDKAYSTFLADCSVWPVINLLQFRVVPTHLRPTVNGIAALLWQSYLSHTSFSAGISQKGP